MRLAPIPIQRQVLRTVFVEGRDQALCDHCRIPSLDIVPLPHLKELAVFHQGDLRGARLVGLEVLPGAGYGLALHSGEDASQVVRLLAVAQGKRKCRARSRRGTAADGIDEEEGRAGLPTAASTSSGVESSLTPRRVSSSRIGFTITGSYMELVAGMGLGSGLVGRVGRSGDATMLIAMFESGPLVFCGHESWTGGSEVRRPGRIASERKARS